MGGLVEHVPTVFGVKDLSFCGERVGTLPEGSVFFPASSPQDMISLIRCSKSASTHPGKGRLVMLIGTEPMAST